MDGLPVSRADLMRFVREQASDRPLDNLSFAVALQSRLAKLGDEVVGAFVGEARDGGLSWAQVGTSLGVTRQAAQQRYATPLPPLGPASPGSGADGILAKASPFSAVRVGDDGGIEVQVEIGGAWYGLVEVDGWSIDDVLAACRHHYRARWFKRLSEDLDDVFAHLGDELGSTVQVVLLDAGGRRVQRRVEATIAKRRAAWRFNRTGGR